MTNKRSPYFKYKIVDEALHSQFNEIHIKREDEDGYSIFVSGQTFGFIAAIAALIDRLHEISNVPSEVLMEYIGFVVEAAQEAREELESNDFMLDVANKFFGKEEQ